MRHLETDRDTICALATAPGMGAISVIRISGARAPEVIRKIASFIPENPESHKIYYGFLRAEGVGMQALDEVLVSYFAKGRSFSGEESFEISCHGAAVVVDEIIRALLQAGARPARRGEFTYRAFMNGRIDLVQAESVQALVESRSQRAAALALRQLQGHFSKEIHGILSELTWILAHLEAAIDFTSEDIETVPPERLAVKLEAALLSVRALIGGYKTGVLIRGGFHVALCGRPNAGKSSLLNSLAGEEKAIVSDTPGTTRDFVEARLAFEGLELKLIDTAGLRLSDDPVEKIGVQRTIAQLAQVDLVFYTLDATCPVGDGDREFFSHIPWEKTLLLVNKTDLNSYYSPDPEICARALGIFAVSAKTGKGLAELKNWLKSRVHFAGDEDSTLVSNARHFAGLEIARHSLEAALPLLKGSASPDLIALELQTGLRAIHEILGLTFDDQVMDRVFAEFCLGK